MAEQRRRARNHASRPGPARWAIAGVSLLAILVVGALIWLGQVRTPPSATVAELNTPVDGKTIGYPNASVEVTEWGDFQ
jgi:hypothetical protein